MLHLMAIAGTLFAADSAITKLATFDGANGTSWIWRETNDPVMGGKSTGTFVTDVQNKIGVFNGTCAIVPSLQAPGFCNAISEKHQFYPDISSYMAKGTIQLRVRSTTPSFQGFRLALAAKGVPHTSVFGGGSFKAGFNVTDTDWQIVQIDFTAFSYDWSPYTGRCDTKDPTGQQHYCCTPSQVKYCPTVQYMASITDVEIWAEGAEGDFHLEVDWIGAGDQ